MEKTAVGIDRTAEAVSAVADVLREEMHESVARVCRPALLELTRMHKGMRISIVRTPRMPTAVLCVPALLSDDFNAESDMVKWLSHSGEHSIRRTRMIELVNTIVTAVSRLDACGLEPKTLVVDIAEDYTPEDDERARDAFAEIEEPGVTGLEEGLRSLKITGRDGGLFQIWDSSLAYPEAMRIGTDGTRTLLTRPQVASLIPALLRFLTTGSIAPRAAS